MYQCEDCGQTFQEPVDKLCWEHRPDGALEPMRYVYCPWCGGAHFEKEEADEA